MHSSIPGLTICPGAEIPCGRARFDLAWLMENHGDTWQASVDYSTDLFERETIVALIAGYREMAAAMTIAPDCRVSQVRL